MRCDACEVEEADCGCELDCCRPTGFPQVIGLDLSMTCTGVAGYRWVDVVKTTGKRTDTLIDRAVRIDKIASRVADLIRLSEPVELVAIEGPSYASKDPGIWDRAGLWWLIVAPLIAAGTPVAVVPPACLKKYATGKGNASKDEVLLAASRRYPTAEITENNSADAQVLYAMGCDWLGHQLETVPQVNRNALASVAWPEVIA